MVNFRRLAVILSLIALVIISASCTKGPGEETTSSKLANANQQEVLAKAPHLSTTVRGDIERIGLAVQGAREALQQNKWTEVVSQLQGANKEVTAALADTPEKKKTAIVRQYLEELKPALERTINTATSRSKETESQLNELQTRVNALKTYSSQ
jgi:hypothetical protein